MATASFVRRVNPDSTTDSICLICYQTIESKPDMDLEMAERMHFCRIADVHFAQHTDSQRGTF